ncbi:MAG: helix-turn-helix domain-containing protein [Candidatus Methanofastidiosia archaeon]
MKEFRASRKEDMIKQIREGFSENEVYVSLRPSIDIIVELLENGPNLSAIYCPSSLFELTSQRVRTALDKVGVSLKPYGSGAGRPRIYTNNDIREIQKLKQIGIPITRISEELEIPRRTIYYLLKEKEMNENF